MGFPGRPFSGTPPSAHRAWQRAPVDGDASRTAEQRAATPSAPHQHRHHLRRHLLARTAPRRNPTSASHPPATYTSSLKKQQLAAWGDADQNPSHYEEDHLISLELGGAPWSKKNLWLEPLSQAKKSEPLENAWHKKLCNGTLTLKQAQRLELAYKRKDG